MKGKGRRAAGGPCSSVQAGCSAALLIRGRYGSLAIGIQTSNDVSRPVSRQDLRKIGLATAFELLFLHGTAPFRQR